MRRSKALGSSTSRPIAGYVGRPPDRKRGARLARWRAAPWWGYENHAGRTYLASDVKAFGSVASSAGKGNNGEDKADGVLHRNVVATYLHGPLLPKNPEVADCLVRAALERRFSRTGVRACELSALDDAVETAANEYVVKRFASSSAR